MKNQKPSVAFVVDTLSRGGAETVALSLANWIDPTRYECCMLSTRAPGAMFKMIRPGIEFHALMRSSRFDFRAIGRMARYFDKRRVSIVHSHNHSSAYLCRLALLLSRRRWKHVVHDHHGPAVASTTTTVLDKLFLRHVDAYLGVSVQLRDRAERIIGVPRDRCFFIQNGVSIPQLQERPRNEITQIVQVGRVEEVKNHLMSVRAIVSLRNAGYRFNWTFVGRQGADEIMFKLRDLVDREGLHDCTHFTGERPGVSEILRKADIGVLTSRHEGMSIALLEYMAHGLPVVISEVGMSSDTVKQAHGGFTVAQDDHVSLARAVGELIEDESTALCMGRANREYAVAHFSEKAMAESAMAIYDHLVEK